MRKLKVIIIANDTTYTYNLRNEIIERLVMNGHEVIVASEPLLLKEELQKLGCRLIDIETDRHGTNPFSDFGLLVKYITILKSEKPDIVLTYNIKPNIYGGIACRITNTKYLPNITGLGTAVEYPGILQHLTIRMYKAGVAGADCVFFQNNDNLAFFKNKRILNKNTRTCLLPGSGVSLKVHKPLPYPDECKTIHFLFIARVMKEKGIDLYLGAARRIYDKHKNVVFHICGKCDDENYLEILKTEEKKGYIIYHGEQKDMIPFFSLSHCIVHPSYYPEGMSNVLLEAAAHCRPIITTNRAGCREIVDDGVNGFVVHVKDEDELTFAMEKFLKMNSEQKIAMGVAGRIKVERYFDRQLVVKAYIEELEKIFNDK